MVVAGVTALVVDAVGPSKPSGHGPQALWPTPILEFWDPRPERAGSILAEHVRDLASKVSGGQTPPEWRSPDTQFLQGSAAGVTNSIGGHENVEKMKSIVRRFVEASLRRYLREALNGSRVTGLVDVGIEKSWATLSSRWAHEAPHVQAQTSLIGTFFAACGGGGAGSTCETRLEDPRPPAATSDMPQILRERLGFGEAHTFKLRPGSVLIHPAWIVHANVPDAHGERVAVPFTAYVRHSSGSNDRNKGLTVETRGNQKRIDKDRRSKRDDL